MVRTYGAKRVIGSQKIMLVLLVMVVFAIACSTTPDRDAGEQGSTPAQQTPRAEPTPSVAATASPTAVPTGAPGAAPTPTITPTVQPAPVILKRPENLGKPVLSSEFVLLEIGSLTDDPDEVIQGWFSVKGSFSGLGRYTPYIRTSPASLPLTAGHTYEVSFDFRILTTPEKGIGPRPGFETLFYSPTGGGENNFLPSIGIDGVAGDTGSRILTNTLGNYDDYRAQWNVIGTGAIAIDNIRIKNLTTGEEVALEDSESTVPVRGPRALPIVEIERLSCQAGTGYGEGSGTGHTTSLSDSQSQETQIFVDGFGDDWAGKPLLFEDPPGNGESGILDLSKGYAFVNDHAVYLLVEPDDPDAEFTQFVVQFDLGARRLQIAWAPHWSSGVIADVTGRWTEVGNANRSSFALGQALEARIDLRDLGLPDSVVLNFVWVRAGECCEQGIWRIADSWEPRLALPNVDESDPAWKLAPVAGAIEAKRMLSAPDTREISLRYDAESRRAEIVGRAGAVPEGSSVLIGTTELNDFVMLNADSTGAFTTDVAAAPGTHVIIKQDVTGQMNPLRDMADSDMIAPGVVLRVPVAQADEGVTFAAGARMCCNKELSASWTLEGTFEEDRLSPGQQFEIKGQAAVLTDSTSPPSLTNMEFRVFLIADADGRQVGRSGKFITPFLTQTGLPIERAFEGPPQADIWLGKTTVSWIVEDSRWVADFAATVRVPEDIRPGLYGLTAGGLHEVRNAAPEPPGFRTVSFSIRDNNAWLANLGAVTIGETEPMRLAATLLADQMSEGSRGGLLAREDLGSFDLSTRAVTRHEPVLPRLDGYGDAWSYRLEPYLPMVDAVDRSFPNPPSLLFDFDDSELTISIEKPDGESVTLGPAPLMRYASKSPRTPWHTDVGAGGGVLREIPQLQGAGDEFAYQFPADGEYVITLDGHIAGINGRRHLIQGTYDLTIANVLDIETALLPTTPFEVDDSMPITLTVYPQVPAEILYTVTQVGADGELNSESFRGRANPNGWWDGDGGIWNFDQDGEYRVDVQACYSDPQAGSWAGRIRLGGLVATPDSPIVAHGRRGSDGLIDIAAPWGFENDYEYRPGVTGPHMHFPYFTGDILWGTEQLHDERENNRNAGTAVVSHMSFQSLDDDDPLVQRAIVQARLKSNFDGQPADAMIQAGQIPLLTAPDDMGSRDIGAHPDDIDLWAYVYSSAERPGVRVREIIKGDDVGGSYWRFGDPYHMQSGNGRQGDLPGDFKFLYGGAVIRDAVQGEGIYAIYGSSWVLLPDDDPNGSRFMPPFQGAAGGPDGGPLFTVHDRDIDMFFMPMGVRPGAVLETGNIFRMAGPIMPTLPSIVTYTVTAPDGSKRTFDGRANAVGYFYDPADDFVLDQPGLWKVELAVTHDGMTSAGPVEQPYPTGGLLTPDGMSFTFAVNDQNSIILEISTDLEDLTPADWFDNIRNASFETSLPSGWSGNEARLTVTMPGTVLIDEMVSIDAGLVSWDLDGEALSKLAKNFDYDQGIADTITVTIFADGLVSGQPAQAVGTIVTHGARVPLAPSAG